MRADKDGIILIKNTAEFEAVEKWVLANEKDMLVRFENPVPNGPKANFRVGPYRIEFQNVVVWDRKGLRTEPDIALFWLGNKED